MSRFIECAQGSAEWVQSRCGLITASRFADCCKEVGGLNDQQRLYVGMILAGMPEKAAYTDAGYKAAPRSAIISAALRGEKTTDFSDEAKRYAADLSIEIISGIPQGEPVKAWVLERGHKMEAEARMLYEGRHQSFITESGICVDDEGFGYSSDGLADDDGLIEIKAPIDSSKIMAMWRTGDTAEYDHQMQGGMWITGRKWCDFVMYVPALASVGKDLYVKRIMRNDEFIDRMVDRLSLFQKVVEANVAIWRAAA